MLKLVGGWYDCTRLAGFCFLRLRTRPLLYFLLLVAFFSSSFFRLWCSSYAFYYSELGETTGVLHMPLKYSTQRWARPKRSSSAQLACLMVSWSKFKAAPALKGPDGVLCILPSGSIIFVLWTAVLSTAPHPAALPGSQLALATSGLTHLFSYFQRLWIFKLWWVSVHIFLNKLKYLCALVII